MELFFTCPVSDKEYTTDKYTLLAGHKIVTAGHDQKKLKGRVAVDSPCPHCGKMHTYSIDEILCPLDKEKNG